jgi:hypothetical protein
LNVHRNPSKLPAMNRTIAGALTSLVFLVGCSNGTAETDGGEAGGLSYTADTGGPSGPVDAAPEGPAVCVVPASATMVQQTASGPVGCQPNATAPFNCPDLTTSFKLACSASDPTNIPPPPSALGCNFAPNGTVGAASLFYCCPCM